jgi:curli production assembly/transport component CsgF
MRRLSYLSAVLALPATLAAASELVYVPVNPSFGGNPLNGPHLLNMANAQNKLSDPASISPFGRAGLSQLDQFNQRLQSLILDRIAGSLTSGLFDASGDLQPGIVETSSFVISIVDQGGGMLLITTTDKASGASSSFLISNTP